MTMQQVQPAEGMRCEQCGMVATTTVVDQFGVTHSYCEHHLPSGLAETLGQSSHEQLPSHAAHMSAHQQAGHDSGSTGHNKHAGHSVNMFRDRFWLALGLTLPTLLYSETFQALLHFQAPVFPGSSFIPLLGGTAIFFTGGTVFLRSALGELRARMPGMMTLISLAILAAYGYSLAIAVRLVSGEDFFWELATLITIMLLGHWLEMRAVSGAQGALQELAKLLPDTAERVTDTGLETVALAELRVGDRLLIRPGAKVPADGTVDEGSSSVNEALLTGESRPVVKEAGVPIIAGSINGEGSLKVVVTNVGDKTALAGIMRLVAQALQSRSKTQMIADQAAFVLTIAAISTSLVAAVWWVATGATIDFTLERVVGVLVIACPHALGLAVPLVTSISTTLGARHGVLVRERVALEAARRLDLVLFDKTGTLTKGEHGVTDVFAVKSGEEVNVLQLAASVESESEHIIARGLVARAKQDGLALAPVKDFQALPGLGVQGMIDTLTIMVGGPNLLQAQHLSLPKAIEAATTAAGRQGKTVVYVLKDGSLLGAVALADLIRDESRQAIVQLQAMGVRTAMLTGDSEDVAKWVAGELGITEYFAQVLPAKKAEAVQKLQQDGSRVAMVGDGVNDAPALTQADVGIAIGAGTDVAIESAGIILVRNDPRDVAGIITLSRATYRKMIENLFWATGYNVVAIPLAAGVLAGQGILLPPAVAAIFMSLSTVVVAANAMLLRRVEQQLLR